MALLFDVATIIIDDDVDGSEGKSLLFANDDTKASHRILAKEAPSTNATARGLEYDDAILMMILA